MRLFIFLIDFVVPNFDLNPKISLISGKTFLVTRRALIDVPSCHLTMRSHDKVEVLKAY